VQQDFKIMSFIHDAVYLSGTPCQLPVLDDAVYLYLRAVNITLAEGFPDFSDGRLIRNKTVGQRFLGT